MATKVMISLQDKLAVRMKAAIPARERSKVIAILLENEITKRERMLYLCAKELEENASLRKEMEVWDSEFGGDGLEDV
jgi:hypothetical protein